MKQGLLVIAFLFISSIYSNAAHIIGGDFSVSWVSGNTFDVELKLFRDCFGGGALFDGSITITIFDSNTDMVTSSFEMTDLQITNIPLGDECYTPTSLCVEQGVYSKTIELQNNPGGYYLVWERCCRNGIISNLAVPGDEGMVFVCTIANPALQNSTPVFDAYPSTGYFCIGIENVLNFNVTDIDGDSLVYFFDYPLSGDSTGNPFTSSLPASLEEFAGPKPYTPCAWATGYSLDNILNTTIPMTIDQLTGDITAIPELSGVYVMAIYVAEFRDGVQIGSVRREIQFQSVVCTVDYPPVFTSPPDSSYYEIIAENLFELEIVVQDQNASDPVVIEATSELFDPHAGNPSVFESEGGNGTVIANFSWLTECVNLSGQTHEVILSSFSDGCSGFDTTFHHFFVKVIPDVDGHIENAANVFTPNNDNRNDYFSIDVEVNPCYDTFNVMIYDRWGKKVFESSDPLFKWDGTNMFSGSVPPEGTYFYIIDASFKDIPYRKTSSISLFR